MKCVCLHHDSRMCCPRITSGSTQPCSHAAHPSRHLPHVRIPALLPTAGCEHGSSQHQPLGRLSPIWASMQHACHPQSRWEFGLEWTKKSRYEDVQNHMTWQEATKSVALKKWGAAKHVIFHEDGSEGQSEERGG